MYEWQFSPLDSSLPLALTDCRASSLLLRHISSYAADCSHRTKWLLLHVVLMHCSRDTLSESSYKQKSGRKLYSSHAWSYERRELSMSKFSLWLIYSTCRNAKRKPQQKKPMCVNYTTVAVCKQITLLILYSLNSRLVIILKIIDATSQVSDIFYLTVGFKF